MPERMLRAAAWGVSLLVVLPLTVLPLRAVADVWRSPALWPQELGWRGFAYVFSTGAGVGPAVWNSLVVGVMATGLALVVGWPAARVLGERRLRRSAPVIMVLAIPLLVPGYAVGTGLAEWFIRLGLADTRLGLVLAHLVYVLPYVVLLLAPTFARREVTELEETARTLGAGPARRLVSVTIPAAAPGLTVASLIGFLVSWSQYGTSLAVGGGLPMLPLVLLPFVQTDPQVASALAVLFLAPAVVALGLATRILGRPLA